MNSISSVSYIDFLFHVQDVSKEAGCSLVSEETINQYRENPQLLELIKGFPTYTVEQVAESVQIYTTDLLLLYFAAERAELKPLASRYLIQWQTKLDNAVRNLEVNTCNSFANHGINSSVNDKLISEFVQKKVKKIHLPSLGQNSLEYENRLSAGLQSILAKEILCQAFHQSLPDVVPDYVTGYLANRFPTPAIEYLINRYAPTITHISFDKNISSTALEDCDIQNLLIRFPNAKTIDLSGCISLTKQSFRNGHSNLETLILSGTRICEDDISKEKFPALKSVIQEHLIKVYDLQPPAINFVGYDYSSISEELWKEYREQIELADVVLMNDLKFSFLINAFKKEPNFEAYHTLESIRKHHAKFRDCPDSFYDGQGINKAIFHVIKFATLDQLKDTKSIQRFFFNEALTKSNKNNGAMKDFYSWLFESLSLPNDKDMMNRAGCRKVTEREEQLANFILKQMRELKCSYVGLTEKIVTHLRLLDSELFFQSERKERISLSQDERGRDQTVASIEHFNAMYSELSHHMNIDPRPFLKLEDPSKVTRRNRPLSGNFSGIAIEFISDLAFGETVHATNPELYKEPTDQTLACAFVLNVSSREKREEMLRNILDNFMTYSTSSPYYPLAKVILGTVEEKDIPPYAKESPLKDRLLNYPGIFEENINEDLKEEFWKALSQGFMGGNINAFIDGLVILYHRDPDNLKTRRKILDTLKSIGKIIFNGPISRRIYSIPYWGSDYARQKYKELASCTIEEMANLSIDFLE